MTYFSADLGECYIPDQIRITGKPDRSISSGCRYNDFKEWEEIRTLEAAGVIYTDEAMLRDDEIRRAIATRQRMRKQKERKALVLGATEKTL